MSCSALRRRKRLSVCRGLAVSTVGERALGDAVKFGIALLEKLRHCTSACRNHLECISVLLPFPEEIWYNLRETKVIL